LSGHKFRQLLPLRLLQGKDLQLCDARCRAVSESGGQGANLRQTAQTISWRGLGQMKVFRDRHHGIPDRDDSRSRTGGAVTGEGRRLLFALLCETGVSRRLRCVAASSSLQDALRGKDFGLSPLKDFL
jgi:hypothetical protein